MFDQNYPGIKASLTKKNSTPLPDKTPLTSKNVAYYPVNILSSRKN